MKISVGVKIFGVVVVLLILVGAAAWYNADKQQDVQTLLQDVDDAYIPAYQSLARASLRSVEEGLYARRLVIARLQAPDDKAEIQRLELATAGKSRDADTELDIARRIIGREISDSRSLEDKPELARLDTRLEFLQSRHRDLETVLTTLEAALCAAATGRRSGSRSRRAKPTTTSLPLTFWHA